MEQGMKTLCVIGFVSVLLAYVLSTQVLAESVKVHATTVPMTADERTLVLYTDEPFVIKMPQHVADLWRVIVVAQAGIALGFLLKILHHFFKVKKDARDQLLHPSAGICFVYFGLTLYIGLDLASRIDLSGMNALPFVTWRTPAACLLFLVSDVSLYKLMRRFGKMLRSANKEQSVRLTVTEVHQGRDPDTDLSTGSPVIPGSGGETI
jgi:hypothetical protein